MAKRSPRNQAFIDPGVIQRYAEQAIVASRSYYARKSNAEIVKPFQLPKDIQMIKHIAGSIPWVQTFLNITADEGPKCGWQAYYKGKLVDDNLIVNRVIDGIKPEDGSQQEMRSRSLYLQGLCGLHAATRHHTKLATFYDVHTPEAVTHSNKPGLLPFVKVLDDPDDRKSGEDYPQEDVGRLIVRDKSWSNQPWTHLQGVIKEMVLFCCLRDSLNVAAAEKKFMPALLQFKEQYNDQGYIDDDDEGHEYGAQEVIDSYFDRAMSKSNGDANIASSFPFPFSFDGELNYIPLGDLVSSESIESVRESTRTAIDGLPVPNGFIYEGEGGSSNHWGDAAMVRAVITRRIQPELQKNDHFWTEFAFQPELVKKFKASRKQTSRFGDPRDWELRSDTSCIEVRPDNSKDLLEFWKCGIPIPMKTIADAASVEILDLPEGVTEFQYFQSVTGNGSTQPAADPTEPPVFPEESNILDNPNMLTL